MGTCSIMIAACRQATKQSAAETAEDSSLLPVTDTTPGIVVDSAIANGSDTITYDAALLSGRWLQPVPGRDNEWQGFELRKNGKATSINTYSMVYEKWTLQHDTLLLWNHSEVGITKDTTHNVDTIIIKALTDTSLVLFPVKAAEGYLENYRKEKEGKKQKLKNK